ncbi:MAG: transcriptional repressor [Nanoarchaeota archaeon]
MVEKRETKQKKAIELAVGKINKFFTAEELHERLKKDNPTLGIATIYRFLKELQKERVIHTYVCDRRSLYSKKEMNHSHFICESCGMKKHLHLDKIDFLKKLVDEDVCHVQIEISGICSDCKLKNLKH